ncbi:MAG: helix-hairpin-helix domain-containing protein [Anaeroplasmataceae bacterium]|nr:helix-hairpin-helix domain-containing protein [Anaeroplasmataceae bacterium]
MYKRKETLIILCFMLCLIGGFLVPHFIQEEPTNSVIQDRENKIEICVEGEVVRKVELTCYQPISYGALFLKIKYCFNEYSDLSGFKLDEIIMSSKTIQIPTLDWNNHFEEQKIFIHTAGIEELVKLPQIGEKRAQKIIDYIQKNGRIKNWETLWEVTNVPKEAREQIMEQAIL